MTATSILDSHAAQEVDKVRLNLLKSSDGSAKWTSEPTEHSDGVPCTVITSINGPIEVRIKDETIGKATLEFQLHPASGLAGPREKFMEELISRALQSIVLLGLHPRSQLTITSHILSPQSNSIRSEKYYRDELYDSDSKETNESDPVGYRSKQESFEIVATIVNSISMALLDANYTTDGVLAASTVYQKGGTRGSTSAVLVYSFPSESLALLETIGPLSRPALVLLGEEGRVKARAVYAKIRSTLEDKVNGDNQWRSEQ